jgi:dienelactone hydrolase
VRRLTLLTIVLAVVLAVPAAAWAEVVTRTIEYQHGDVTLAGYLTYDDAIEGRRPGVLVIHEWWGLNDYAKKRARMLAELGYVAFCADMYGKGKGTADARQAGEWAGHLRGDVGAWRQRAVAALDVLKSQPQTDTERIAAIGYCFGGSTVLELAISGADVDAVVSFHGGFPKVRPGADIGAKVMVCHGAADPHGKADDIAAFTNAMNAAPADWLMITYGGAQHSFAERISVAQP